MKNLTNSGYRLAIASAIRRRRTELKLSQGELCRAADISQSALSKIECGGMNASLRFLLRIALVLKMSPGEIFDEAFVPVFVERPEKV